MIGFVAVPIIFATLDDRALAGVVAGNIFTLFRYFAISAMVILLLLRLRFGNPLMCWIGRVTSLILLLLLADQCWLHPQMIALKASGLSDSDEFDLMHKISSTLYTINAVLGLVLLKLVAQSITKAALNEVPQQGDR